MADLDTTIPQLSFGQSDKETTVNELFDAASPAMFLGRNGITSYGLKFGLLGGRVGGVSIANTVHDLPDNATRYISFAPGPRTFSIEAAGFKTGEVPLYKVTTAGGLVTDYEDHRPVLGGGAAGPLVMADITDKQGKVLDDRIPISNWGDVRDGITTKGGYLLAYDDTNGYLGASLVDVVETGGIVAQAINSPLFGQMSRVYTEDDGWSAFILPVTSMTVGDWYNSNTAEAPNAVLNSDGNFSRSVSSDEFKTGIEPMLDEYADAIVQGAQPIYYRSTCDADPDDWSYWGISAEQLAEIDPRLVHWGHSTKEVPQPLGLPPKTVPDLESPLKPVGVQYSRIVPALLNVLKRQGDAIAALEARLAILEGGGQ